MDISDKFSAIIKYQKKLDYCMPSIVNGPAMKSEISDAESELKIVFNKELHELYSVINGVMLSRKTLSGKTGIIPMYDLMSLSDAIQY